MPFDIVKDYSILNSNSKLLEELGFKLRNNYYRLLRSLAMTVLSAAKFSLVCSKSAISCAANTLQCVYFFMISADCHSISIIRFSVLCAFLHFYLF